MSAYACFLGQCPSCGAIFSAQTKLLGGKTVEISVGEYVGISDMRLRLKEPCDECGDPLVAVIENFRLVRYEATHPTHAEGAYGSLAHPDGDVNALVDEIAQQRKRRPIRFESAPVKQVVHYSAEVRAVLHVIAEVCDEPGMVDAWVTDESCVSDFLSHSDPIVHDRERAGIAQRLGVDLSGYLWQVAERVRERNNNTPP